MNSLTHFEIAADKPERAAKFYKAVFGWEIKKWGQIDYWVIDTKHGKKPGINGGLMKRSGLFKKKGGFNSFICTVEVKDIEEIAKKVKKAGGKWANEGGLIHGVGFHQYFKDTEGNIFGALQPDTKAKNVM
jgi:hypothetical protein